MKAQTPHPAAGRAAFTLVELLVVIGLMAMLGTISTAGYFAAVRGMADRGAKQDTMSLIRLAMQTALIDQTPTAVLFYNRRTKEKTGEDGDEAAIVGTAVAIKMVGRITYIAGSGGTKKTICDEFADWNQSYPTAGSDSDPGVRFYRMADLNKVESGIDSCSSMMRSYVTRLKAGGGVGENSDLGEEPMIAANMKVQDWCNLFEKTESDNSNKSKNPIPSSYPNGNGDRWGLQFHPSGRDPGWQVGDAYGMEIASLQLPNGYIYGTSEPNSTKIASVKSIAFNPEEMANKPNDYIFTGISVQISAFRTGADKPVKIGTISQTDLKD